MASDTPPAPAGLRDLGRRTLEVESNIVFVSHILEDVMALCDEVTVLRDGEVSMAASPRAGLTVPMIVDAMLGERQEVALNERVERDIDASAGALELRDVSAGDRLHEFSLTVSSGEIVGLAGVAGAGHHTVMELVAGLARPSEGEVLLPGGKPVPHGLRGAIRAGVALVTGDRRRLGLMLDKPIYENVGQIRSVGLAADGVLVRAGELRRRARAQVDSLRIRSRTVDQPAGSLSGGNQQKVVFAKWLDAQPSVVLLDDPTRGVDVGAKAEMHALIRGTAAAGAPVLICSTDVDELASLCDRVIVLVRGRAVSEFSGEALRTHAILEAMNQGSKVGS